MSRPASCPAEPPPVRMPGFSPESRLIRIRMPVRYMCPESSLAAALGITAYIQRNKVRTYGILPGTLPISARWINQQGNVIQSDSLMAVLIPSGIDTAVFYTVQP